MTKAELKELKANAKSNFVVYAIRKADDCAYIICSFPCYLVLIDGLTRINTSAFETLEYIDKKWDIRTINFEVESPKWAKKEDKKTFELHFKKTLFSFTNK